jgi:hypothetical protein
MIIRDVLQGIFDACNEIVLFNGRHGDLHGSI